MNAHKAGRLILRSSLGFVFLYFGIGKFSGDLWAQTMASMEFFRGLPWSVAVSVKSVGALEVLTGSFLILGVWTRAAALIAAVQLSGILILLDFQEVRDIGLLGMSMYLIVAGDETWGLNRFLFAREGGGA